MPRVGAHLDIVDSFASSQMIRNENVFLSVSRIPNEIASVCVCASMHAVKHLGQSMTYCYVCEASLLVNGHIYWVLTKDMIY